MPQPPHRLASQAPLTVLTIAGHDPSNGAGITADLQTFAANGLFGTSAITALTVQSTLGVAEFHPVAPDLLERTLAHLCADLPPAGIKVGLLGSPEIAATVADFLVSLRSSDSQTYRDPDPERAPRAQAESSASPISTIPIVLDPVLRASSGAELLPPAALDILTSRLLPAVDWITPNWTELAALSGQTVATAEDAEAAMHGLGSRHPRLHIVATGGDQVTPTDLLRLPSGELHRFPGEHIRTTSTHGTGCAFSSALLSRLVLGDSPIQAVVSAKYFVAGALRHAPGLGHGRGPLDLLWRFRRS